MTHELEQIVSAYKNANQKAVLATVVKLDGSSYRRPGVRMLVLEDGTTIGAVSGGCVEKEIQRQAESVFALDIPKMMTYDGRYRLGCEGVLYILIEPFQPDKNFLAIFWQTIKERKSFKTTSYFTKEEGENDELGTMFLLDDNPLFIRKKVSVPSGIKVFNQTLKPSFRLIIIGAEHDAVLLSSFASNMGWKVTVCVSPLEEKTIDFFRGAESLVQETPENIDFSFVDNQTAIVLMTHSYAKDLQYLIALQETKPAYLGLLGPATRREKLLNEFLEHCPEVSDTFFEQIHGPAGLDIGAETPQEISISILSEILTVTRKAEPMRLKNKQGKIHH